MTPARMRKLSIIDIPRVGAVFERIRRGWGWLHRDDTSSGPVGLPTEADARCSLLAYHFQLGVPAAPRRRGGEAALARRLDFADYVDLAHPHSQEHQHAGSKSSPTGSVRSSLPSWPVSVGPGAPARRSLVCFPT